MRIVRDDGVGATEEGAEEESIQDHGRGSLTPPIRGRARTLHAPNANALQAPDDPVVA